MQPLTTTYIILTMQHPVSCLLFLCPALMMTHGIAKCTQCSCYTVGGCVTIFSVIINFVGGAA